MLVNLLENQSKNTQASLGFDIKSNLQKKQNSLSFVELLGDLQSIEKTPSKNIYKSSNEYAEKEKTQSKQEKSKEINTSFLKENQTDSNQTKLNPLEKKEKQQLKENTNQDSDKKKTEKKDTDIIEGEQEKNKKIKKKKMIELSFLGIENTKNEKNINIQKKLKKIDFLVSLKENEKNEPTEKNQKVEINFEKNIKKTNFLLQKNVSVDKELIEKEQTTDTILSEFIDKKFDIKKEEIENHQDVKKKIKIESDLSKDIKNTELSESKKNSQEKENPTNEKTKPTLIASLRENLDLKNEKLENKNIKVSQNTENITSEKSENLGNFKEFNQKQENHSQQKDFFFNSPTQKTNLKSEQIIKESYSQNFSAKDLKSNFKELIQTAKVNILGKGKTTAEIQMNPKELGKMSLKISVNDKQIQGILTVDSEVVKNRLSMELNSLKQDLKVAGFSLDFLNIDLKGENEKKGNFAQFFQEEMNKHLREDYENENVSLQREEEMQTVLSSKKIDIKA